MKKAIAVLSLCGSLLPAVALADEVDDITDKLLKDVPLKCLDEALTISNKHMRSILPDLMLDGAREAAKLGPAWGPGNENYRQARDLLEMALQDDEASNGPLIDAGLLPLMRSMVNSWTPAQREAFPAFLKQKGGRLYWEVIMDGGMCEGMIKSTAKPPYPLQPGAEKNRLDALARDISFRKMSVDLEFNLLPKDQAAKAKKVGPELTESFKQAFTTKTQAYVPRAKQVFQSVVPEMKKIVASYKP